MKEFEYPDAWHVTLERSRHARAYLAHCLSSGNMSPGERVIVNLVGRQSENGSWAAVEYPLWTHVLTALSVQALRASGFDDDSTWTVRSGDRQYAGGIKRALSYLVESRTERGWGEDIHDTCQVLITLLETKTDQAEFREAIAAGVDLVVQHLQTDFEDFRSSNWYGPGFYAAALDALSRTGRNREQVTCILNKLNEMQHPDGYFGDESMPVEFKVFHTALATMALASRGVSLPTSSPTIQRGLAWLEQSQSDNGAWGAGLDRFTVIFVSYGAVALLSLKGGESKAAAKAVQWMLDHQAPDGSIEAIEGTIMGVLTLPMIEGRQPSQIMPITEFIEVDRVLADLESIVFAQFGEVDSARDRVRALEGELRRENEDYLVRITHRRAGQIGLLVGLGGLVLAVLTLLPWFR
jgi:hypothetical protein